LVPICDSMLATCTHHWHFSYRGGHQYIYTLHIPTQKRAIKLQVRCSTVSSPPARLLPPLGMNRDVILDTHRDTENKEEWIPKHKSRCLPAQQRVYCKLCLTSHFYNLWLDERWIRISFVRGRFCRRTVPRQIEKEIYAEILDDGEISLHGDSTPSQISSNPSQGWSLLQGRAKKEHHVEKSWHWNCWV
jgi:hypothetical protein